MRQFVEITCRYCASPDLVKNGHSETGAQRYRCNACRRTFQLTYRYRAWAVGTKEHIEEMTLNSSGVRDIARTLKVSPNTVVAHLKKKRPQDVNPYLLDLMEAEALEQLEVELYYDTAWDELWSYVASKAHPRWTWYLLERHSGVIVAWENGPRDAAALEALLVKVAHLPLRVCYTDGLGAYERRLPSSYDHVVDRSQMWKIERRNLNMRIHLKRLSRKTLCFSKSELVHDNVVGMYIERHYYRHGQFQNAVRANQRL